MARFSWDSVPEVWHSRHVEVIGLSIFGPAPLGAVHIPWERGVTALYGRNGAGKTSILDGIVNALRGRATQSGETYVHLRLLDPEAVVDWNYSYPVTQILQAVGIGVWHKVFDPAHGGLFFDRDDRSLWPSYEEFLGAPNPAASIEGALRLIARSDSALLHAAPLIAKGGIFSLAADGRDESHFSLHISACEGSHMEIDAVIESLRVQFGSEHGGFVNALAIDDWRSQHSRQFLRQQRDAWVPVPLLELGGLDSLFLGVTTEDPIRAIELTNKLIEGEAGTAWDRDETLSEAEGVDVVLAPSDLSSLASRLADRANRLLDELLEDAPVLTLELDYRQIASGDIAQWIALDRPTLEVVPLSSLSRAQQRWASFAIQVALSSADFQNELVGFDRATMPDSFARPRLGVGAVVDEPEQALHQRAIDYLVAGLCELAESAGNPILVGTHSPAFFNRTDINLVHVVRDLDGRTKLIPLEISHQSELDDVATSLGLRRSDLLLRYRTFLLVEGAHDAAVINAIIGDDLDRCRVRVVPMRGARRVMTVAEGEILMDFTDARVVVALDNTRSVIGEAFERAKEMAAGGDLSGARRHVLQSGDDQSLEARLARSLGYRALSVGTAPRFRIFGFEKPDIIEYLPASKLIGPSESWDGLVEVWRRESANPKSERMDFKQWLRRTRGARIDEQVLGEVAGTLDTPDLHSDFARLLQVCCEGHPG